MYIKHGFNMQQGVRVGQTRTWTVLVCWLSLYSYNLAKASSHIVSQFLSKGECREGIDNLYYLTKLVNGCDNLYYNIQKNMNPNKVQKSHLVHSLHYH